jgi:hypothetical protein
MAFEIKLLCRCPYCEHDGGEVLLNVPSFLSTSERREGRFIGLDEQSELDFLIFNSNRPQPGACNHLVFFTGNVKVGGYEEGVECSLEFDWWAPISHQLDSASENLMFEVFNEDNPPQFHKRLPFWTEGYRQRWPEQNPVAEPTCYCEVQGNGFFCRDAAFLFKEIVTQPDKYWDWLNGTNALGAGLFLEGFRTTQPGGFTDASASPECQAVVQAEARDGCEEEGLDEEDHDEED